MEYREVLRELKSMSDPEAVAGMARYGINSDNSFGISIPNLRRLAKQLGQDHGLSEQLWSSGIHEARILASMIDDPGMVTEEQLERWAGDFDSWDVCDQCCNNLFYKTVFSRQKAIEWSSRGEEFVKRAGFVLMACLAVHDKDADDNEFERFFQALRRGASDERGFVKKAVNWALRQIGKRNRRLNRLVIELARQIRQIDSKAAKWIAADALRELQGEKVQKRFKAESVRQRP